METPTPIELLSDREIAEETLVLLRAFAEALSQVSQSPMMRMMPGMQNLLSGM